MDKKEVIAFFDSIAPQWDAGMIIDDETTGLIFDAAGIVPGAVVLDVACGTGVLFPYYQERKVARIVGMDISPEMIRIASANHRADDLEIVCGDIETEPVRCLCDCCMVYNAFPHFEDPQRLVERLAQWLRPGGRLTVAHNMGLEALHRHHSGRARSVSREMLTTAELAAVCAPWFDVDVQISDETKYILSGTRR